MGMGGKMPNRNRYVLILALFIGFRLMMLFTFRPEHLTYFGDYAYYYELASYSDQGHLPFIHYWSEYPPIFPFLSVGIYQVAQIIGGGYDAYVYLMGMVMTAASACSLVVFIRLARHLYQEPTVERLAWVYSLLFAPLIYTWWTFGALTALAFLLTLHLFFEDKYIQSALVMGIGALVKLLPALMFPLVVRTIPWRRWLLYGAVVAVVIALVVVPLLILGGQMAMTSLRASTFWSSWQTVWALLDGNLRTGLLGPASEHFDSSKLEAGVGNPAVIPDWARLVVFGCLYGIIFFKSEVDKGPHRKVAFVCLTLVVFLLWSKGWSPQWQSWLFPLLLLALPLKWSILFILVQSFINLAEWPVFLSRGMEQWLYVTVLVRTALFLLLGVELWRRVRR
jgi:hypothetical protein